MELNQSINYTVTTEDWWENFSVYWNGSYSLVEYDRQILFKRLKNKFVRVLKVSEKTINEEMSLRDDFFLKGIDITFLVCVLECEYDLRSSNKLACQISTIGDILSYCEQTWPSKDFSLWSNDLKLPEPKTQLKRILEFINKLGFINKITTFIRVLLKRKSNPLRKYIIKGRRRCIRIEKLDIHPSEEILDDKWENWRLWNEQDWIDWYGSKCSIYRKQFGHEKMNSS